MTRRTKKVGVAGRYGPRYGVRIRKQMATVITAKNKSYECPRCNHVAVKRVSYTPKVTTRVSMPSKGDTEVVIINKEEGTDEEEA